MYSEDEFLQLSALQHFIFCQRQCALIHIEQLWTENILTTEGKIMHENVHSEHSSNQADIKIARGMAINSHELGLSGKADLVEFHKVEGSCKWIPFPIEYKRGKPKKNNSDKIQLCAQALCFEEMVKIKIPCGALFYGRTRHRLNIKFDKLLRQETRKRALMLHDFIKKGKTPLPIYEAKCKSCSFIEECLPKVISNKISINEYLLKEIAK